MKGIYEQLNIDSYITKLQSFLRRYNVNNTNSTTIFNVKVKGILSFPWLSFPGIC